MWNGMITQQEKLLMIECEEEGEVGGSYAWEKMYDVMAVVSKLDSVNGSEQHNTWLWKLL